MSLPLFIGPSLLPAHVVPFHSATAAIFVDPHIFLNTNQNSGQSSLAAVVPELRRVQCSRLHKDSSARLPLLAKVPHELFHCREKVARAHYDQGFAVSTRVSRPGGAGAQAPPLSSLRDPSMTAPQFPDARALSQPVHAAFARASSQYFCIPSGLFISPPCLSCLRKRVCPPPLPWRAGPHSSASRPTEPSRPRYRKWCQPTQNFREKGEAKKTSFENVLAGVHVRVQR